MGSGLPADSTLYSFLSIANTVLLYNDGNALIAETVSTGENGPLSNTHSYLHAQRCDFFSNAFILQMCIEMFMYLQSKVHIYMIRSSSFHHFSLPPDPESEHR